jgi:hypothetical protein
VRITSLLPSNQRLTRLSAIAGATQINKDVAGNNLGGIQVRSITNGVDYWFSVRRTQPVSVPTFAKASLLA